MAPTSKLASNPACKPPVPGFRSHCSGDAGTGLIGAAFGLFAMMAFLLLAMQLLLTLYTTSVVQTVAFDGARAAATDAPGGSSAVDAELFAIEEQARDALGPIGDDASFVWDSDGQSITLQVSVDAPSLLPESLSSGWSSVSRRAVVRREQLVDLGQ